MKHAFRGLVSAVMVAVGIPAPLQADTMQVEVTVTYRERIALPPDAALSVALLDTSLMDVAAVQMGQQRFKIEGVPMTVAIPYDVALIDERHTYTVSAEITSARETLFRTTTAYPVLTRGAPAQIEIVLEQAAPASNAPGGGVVGLAWQAFEIAGRLLIAEDPPTLTIDADGVFGLFGGCNRYRGQVVLNDGTLSFPEAFAGTRMACPPPRMKLEQDMLDALQASTRYQLSGDALVFTNDAGVATVRFQKQRG